ncbi:methyltransferase TRM13-domain-containing protein [Gigaspora rosea]|uniref:tRNA:m(4)X modification enzyme TRM13 n=1 Tax=Gigaspora rosea TaxID=44941 RepID=A0A397UZ48_9GLOM|nr:methyltransferase TRM13-domain-containing protein [Gigaspora rosea]
MPKEQKQKYLKKEEVTLPPPPDNVMHTIRYCHLPTKIGNNYCGEHLASDPNPNQRERIPCPYDTSHTVYKDELEKHLAQKCNSRPQPNPPYFSLNVNCTISSSSASSELVIEEKVTLSELSKENLDSLINNVNYWFQNFVPKNFETLVLDHEVLKERKKEIIINSKHVTQQASLLGHMARLKLLRPDGCFIEFGCGKGELSYFTKLAIKDEDNNRFLLIDRKNTRGKFDAGIRDAGLSKTPVLRVGMDIKDLDLSKLDFVKDSKIIAYSKHLCGSATDVTLKSLVNYSKLNKNENPIIGIIIALCCHQLCQYHMYPNHQYLEDIGITNDDFKRICTMSSWAICGQRSRHNDKHSDDDDDDHTCDNSAEPDDDDNNVHYSGLDYSSREALGYKCKRILDYGRLKYLQENGFDVELIYYVESSTSLENLALMAVPRKN